jgi:hypothetical protein
MQEEIYQSKRFIIQTQRFIIHKRKDLSLNIEIYQKHRHRFINQNAGIYHSMQRVIIHNAKIYKKCRKIFINPYYEITWSS